MPLLIPSHLAEDHQRVSTVPGFWVCYGLHEVAKRRATPADLIQTLARYRRSDVIRWIAGIAAWTARDGSSEPQNQMAMADALLSEELRAGLRETVHRLGIVDPTFRTAS
jgi:hypothetical protein